MLAVFLVVAVLVHAVAAAEDFGPCYRECVPGETRVCKFKFHEEIYNALNSACGRCADGEVADCFARACVPLDGVERTVYTINRKLPGPALHVCAGDTVIVDLQVRLPGHADTIHWHGLHQRDTPHMDGVSMVTQCPIPSGQTFRYQFVVDLPGTYFYHPHNGIHKVNGAVGVLVGRAPRALDPHADLYDEDLAEHAVFLMDWMHVDAEYVFPGLHKPLGQTPVTVLINGQGDFQQADGNWTKTPLAEFRVRRGLRYRFRVINSGGLSCPLTFRVYGHKLTIIASDSRDVQPLEVDTLYTFSGERYDVVVTADQDGDAFWVHSYAATCSAPAEQVAVLRYDSAADGTLPAAPRPSARPGLLQPEGVVMNSPACTGGWPGQRCATDLQSLEAPDDPRMLGTAEPDDRVVQEVVFHGYTNEELFDTEYYPHFLTFGRNIAGTIGNVSFKMPSTPLLTQPGESPTCGGCAPGESFCVCTHVLPVRLGTRYEIVLVDATDVTGRVDSMITHPMHIHGYSFLVLALGTLANITSGR
ncbi:uncharacterized protein LOC113202909, partial [Frankliniella occidentalis]|uniref:Uncharacterized protein LOC113202909 n=1 Tax=Frankliniella occidentalis TaxID=133901 RepID=A0A6J1RXS7_FRAOC